MYPANNLFSLQHEYIRLLGQIEESEGEITEEIDQALQFTEQRLRNEGAEVAAVIKTMDYWQDSVEAEIKRLEAIKSRLTKGKELLKNRLSGAMQQFGIERIFTDTMTVSLRSSTAVKITDERLIPNYYTMPQPPKILKEMIKASLKAGEDVPGAELEQRKHLRIV